MSSRIPIAPGTQLGRYQILGLAGEGGMGDIYRALDTSLERVVALKRVRSGRPDDATQERFRREALALAQLNHPGVCQVFELAETLHGTFIVMEWVEGETLAERLSRGPLPWREAARILHQVAEALTVAHAKGLVHRDLKPTNLMLTPEGQTKVLDFGLVRFADQVEEDLKPPTGEALALTPEIPFTDPGDAKTFAPPKSLSGLSGSGRALTQVGIFMGTLGYTSPEQALARPVGPPSDVFGLGILAHEMVTGSLPFGGEGRAALDSVVDNQRKPIPHRRASSGYRALVDRMLARKPKERPTAPEVANALEDLLSPHGPLWWSSLSAAAILLLVFGSYWIFGRGVLAGLVKGRPARLAVMGFRNETGQDLLRAQAELGLGALISAGLHPTAKLQVVDSEALAKAAQLLKLNPAEASPADQQRLAKAIGADLYLVGSITREGGKDHLRYQLVDTSGGTRASSEVVAPILSDIVLSAPSLSKQITSRIQKAVDPLGKESMVAEESIPPDAFESYSQGVDSLRHSRVKEAEPYLKRASYSAPGWGAAVSAYANSLVLQSKAESDPVLRWALITARKSGNPQEEVGALELLGTRALDLNEATVATGYFEQALTQARTFSDNSSIAFSLNGLGRVAYSKEDYPDAEQKYLEALTIARKAGDRITEVQIDTNLGNIALVRGDLDGAGRYYQGVADASKSMGYEFGEALGLNNWGITLLSEFRIKEARPVLERAYSIREKNGFAPGIISGARNLGILAQMEGNLKLAQVWFRRSLDEALSISDASGAAKARFYSADLLRRNGKLKEAFFIYQQAGATFDSIHDEPRLGMQLAAAAECSFRLHAGPSADHLLAKATRLIPGNPYLLRAQAWYEYLKGNKAEAMHFLEEAIKDPHHDGPEIQLELIALHSHFQSGIPLP